MIGPHHHSELASPQPPSPPCPMGSSALASLLLHEGLPLWFSDRCTLPIHTFVSPSFSGGQLAPSSLPCPPFSSGTSCDTWSRLPVSTLQALYLCLEKHIQGSAHLKIPVSPQGVSSRKGGLRLGAVPQCLGQCRRAAYSRCSVCIWQMSEH